ncbi:hypothetical protein [Anaeromyxobacter oryzae]|uniref:Uncharacterized protein n=1 Tax=Anaeromyxobacter oryzae TaxID=2918170 RepID=A0ABM7X4C7_9BACT|nr:hypothetical protein [Anaeromyxobacter oryzae]BDG06658.1 hypothetical protein AMOR_56540 [Anaeromyxobacter oryzae]
MERARRAKAFCAPLTRASHGYGPPHRRKVLVRMLPLLGIGVVRVSIGLRGCRRAERRG